jgi:hypothetical protein
VFGEDPDMLVLFSGLIAVLYFPGSFFTDERARTETNRLACTQGP